LVFQKLANSQECFVIESLMKIRLLSLFNNEIPEPIIRKEQHSTEKGKGKLGFLHITCINYMSKAHTEINCKFLLGTT
jgi:hypothetical protein